MSQQEESRRRGCLVYTGVAVAISVAVLIAASYIGYRYAKSLIHQFTDTHPMLLPAPALSEGEVAALKTRISTFEESVRQGTASDPLMVTDNELNALVVSTPELVTVRGQLRFEFEGSNVLAQMSVPAEDLGLKPMKGRYVNASGSFSVIFTNGVLNVNAADLKSKGEPLPETFMNRISPQNFAYRLNHDPKAKEFLSRLGDVRVEQGRLILIPRR